MDAARMLSLGYLRYQFFERVLLGSFENEATNHPNHGNELISVCLAPALAVFCFSSENGLEAEPRKHSPWWCWILMNFDEGPVQFQHLTPSVVLKLRRHSERVAPWFQMFQQRQDLSSLRYRWRLPGGNDPEMALNLVGDIYILNIFHMIKYILLLFILFPDYIAWYCSVVFVTFWWHFKYVWAFKHGAGWQYALR